MPGGAGAAAVGALPCRRPRHSDPAARRRRRCAADAGGAGRVSEPLPRAPLAQRVAGRRAVARRPEGRAARATGDAPADPSRRLQLARRAFSAGIARSLSRSLSLSLSLSCSLSLSGPLLCSPYRFQVASPCPSDSLYRFLSRLLSLFLFLSLSLSFSLLHSLSLFSLSLCLSLPLSLSRSVSPLPSLTVPRYKCIGTHAQIHAIHVCCVHTTCIDSRTHHQTIQVHARRCSKFARNRAHIAKSLALLAFTPPSAPRRTPREHRLAESLLFSLSLSLSLSLYLSIYLTN